MTVSTPACVTMEESVTECLERVCVLPATWVPHVKTGVLMELSAVDVSTLAYVNTAPSASTTQERVCVLPDSLEPFAREVRKHTMHRKAVELLGKIYGTLSLLGVICLILE